MHKLALLRHGQNEEPREPLYGDKP